MSTAVALFVDYPLVPKAIRDHGRQPGFQFGHCMLIRPFGSYSPGWLDEFAGETDVIGGTLRFTDCVPASGVRGVNFMSYGTQAPTTPAEREALQAAMGTKPTVTEPGKGADEVELAAGIVKRYGRAVPFGQDWAAIVAAIGSESTEVIVGDPLASSDFASPPTTLGSLKPASAGLDYRYVLFTQQPQPLPDTGTGDDSVDLAPYVVKAFDPNARMNFKAGTHTAYKPDGTRKAAPLAADSGAHVSCTVAIPSGVVAIHGGFAYVVDGIWAGLYMPLWEGESWSLPRLTALPR